MNGNLFYSVTCSDFRLTGETDSTEECCGSVFGSVVITTRILFWRHRQEVSIARFRLSPFWIRLDTSQATPGAQVQKLEMAERLRREHLLATDPMVGR